MNQWSHEQSARCGVSAADCTTRTV